MRTETARSPRSCHVHEVRTTAAIISAVAAAFVAVPSSADLLQWNNLAGGSAATPANWSPVQLPAAGDELRHSWVATYGTSFNSLVPVSSKHTYNRGTVSIFVTDSHTVNNGITVGNEPTYDASLIIGGGTFISTGPVVIGGFGDSGGLTLSDDDCELLIQGAAGTMAVADDAPAAMNILDGAKVVVDKELLISSAIGAEATIVIDGFSVAPNQPSLLDVLGNGQSSIGPAAAVDLVIRNGARAHFAGDVRLLKTFGVAGAHDLTVETAGNGFDARLVIDGDLDFSHNPFGASGDARLHVNAGGRLTVGGHTRIGRAGVTGFGSLDISGGTVTMNSLDVQLGGYVALDGGSLTVANGITVDSNWSFGGHGTINGDIDTASEISCGGVGDTLTINGLVTCPSCAINDFVFGGGTINFGPASGYTGRGIIEANVTGDATAAINATGTLTMGENTNAGYNFPGALSVGSHAVTLIDANGALVGGQTTIAGGSITCASGITNQLNAHMRGSGTIAANVINNGVFNPHSDSATGGMLDVQGDLTLGRNGVVDFTVGGTPASGNADAITVTGSAIVAGTLRVNFKNGYIPNRGDQYPILTAAGGRTGTFGVLNVVVAPCNGATFSLVYNATGVALRVNGPDADTTNDGFINVSDLLAVISAWGACPIPADCQADTNGDSVVNVTDLLAVISAWGACP